MRSGLLVHLRLKCIVVGVDGVLCASVRAFEYAVACDIQNPLFDHILRQPILFGTGAFCDIFFFWIFMVFELITAFQEQMLYGKSASTVYSMQKNPSTFSSIKIFLPPSHLQRKLKESPGSSECSISGVWFASEMFIFFSWHLTYSAALHLFLCFRNLVVRTNCFSPGCTSQRSV